MRVVKFFKELGWLLYGLAAAVRAKIRQRKLPPYFAKKLPERYVKSPIYDVYFDWYQGLCYATITLDLRLDGFDPTGIDLNRKETTGRLQQEALRIAEEYLSDPPIPVELSFALMFRDGSPKYIIPVGIFPRKSEQEGI